MWYECIVSFNDSYFWFDWLRIVVLEWYKYSMLWWYGVIIVFNFK